MFADDNAFRTALMDHKVYSAWQFIEYTRKNIETVQYCFVTLNNIISKLSTKTVRWEQDLFSDFVEDVVFDGKKARRITVTTENMPVYELHVAGEKVDPWFLFDKLLRDFYQYCMISKICDVRPCTHTPGSHSSSHAPSEGRAALRPDSRTARA